MANGQVDGKQGLDGSITEAKLATAYTSEVIKRNGSVAFTGTVSLGSQRITNLTDPSGAQDAATRNYVDNAIAGMPNKTAVRAASTGNLTLSAPQTIDGVSVIAGDRVLAKDQTTASANGIYVVAAGAWTRASDADAAAELLGAIAFVSEGTINDNQIWKQTANAPITVGSTSLTWVQVGATPTLAVPSKLNKGMTASVTTTDGDAACATAIGATPQGYPFVDINGIIYQVGDAVKTTACYLSGDSGATARAIGAIVSGDTLRWNGTVAGFQLAVTDKVSIHFAA